MEFVEAGKDHYIELLKKEIESLKDELGKKDEEYNDEDDKTIVDDEEFDLLLFNE